ncbi:MAG: hypothetical protein FWC41_03665 [Firmicutes bacterium]|nr:hypothetical protein [Bacillota bacterium]
MGIADEKIIIFPVRIITQKREIDRIIEGLYEDKISGVINEERFIKMSNRFEDEQLEVKQQIKNLEKKKWKSQRCQRLIKI